MAPQTPQNHLTNPDHLKALNEVMKTLEGIWVEILSQPTPLTQEDGLFSARIVNLHSRARTILRGFEDDTTASTGFKSSDNPSETKGLPATSSG